MKQNNHAFSPISVGTQCSMGKRRYPTSIPAEKSQKLLGRGSQCQSEFPPFFPHPKRRPSRSTWREEGKIEEVWHCSSLKEASREGRVLNYVWHNTSSGQFKHPITGLPPFCYVSQKGTFVWNNQVERNRTSDLSSWTTTSCGQSILQGWVPARLSLLHLRAGENQPWLRDLPIQFTLRTLRFFRHRLWQKICPELTIPPHPRWLFTSPSSHRGGRRPFQLWGAHHHHGGHECSIWDCWGWYTRLC